MNFESTSALGKILSGIAKSLNVANQLIPLYQDTKPLLKNAKGIYDLVINRDISKKEEVKEIKKEESLSLNSQKKDQNNGPQFFI